MPSPRRGAPRGRLVYEELRLQLAEFAELNGVSHRPVNLQRRADYFAAIRSRIVHLQVEISVFAPAGHEYLCTLIDGVTSPRLHYSRELQQLGFVSPLGDSPLNVTAIVPNRPDDNEGNYTEGGLAEADELKFMWENWAIPFAFKLGFGPRGWGGCWALHCRLDKSEPLQWRHGLHNEEWYSDVYDSVEDFLEYHANDKEQKKADLLKAITLLTAHLVPPQAAHTVVQRTQDGELVGLGVGIGQRSRIHTDTAHNRGKPNNKPSPSLPCPH